MERRYVCTWTQFSLLSCWWYRILCASDHNSCLCLLFNFTEVCSIELWVGIKQSCTGFNCFKSVRGRISNFKSGWGLGLGRISKTPTVIWLHPILVVLALLITPELNLFHVWLYFVPCVSLYWSCPLWLLVNGLDCKLYLGFNFFVVFYHKL